MHTLIVSPYLILNDPPFSVLVRFPVGSCLVVVQGTTCIMHVLEPNELNRLQPLNVIIIVTIVMITYHNCLYRRDIRLVFIY